MAISEKGNTRGYYIDEKEEKEFIENEILTMEHEIDFHIARLDKCYKMLQVLKNKKSIIGE